MPNSLRYRSSITIVFDYDDTFLPTSAIEGELSKHRIFYSSRYHLTSFLQYKLHQIDLEICKLLKYCSDKANVIILTNSEGEGRTSWLWKTSFNYLPNFHHQFIANRAIPFYSAHYRYRHCSADPLEWKRYFFYQDIYCGHTIKHRPTRLISVGDGEPEYRAATYLKQKVGANVTSIQLPLKPLASTLLNRLVALPRELQLPDKTPKIDTWLTRSAFDVTDIPPSSRGRRPSTVKKRPVLTKKGESLKPIVVLDITAGETATAKSTRISSVPHNVPQPTFFSPPDTSSSQFTESPEATSETAKSSARGCCCFRRTD